MTTETPQSSRISPQEYYRVDQSSEIRHELIDGQIYVQPISNISHSRVVGNTFAILHAQLRGRTCAPFLQNQRLEVEQLGNYYFPDAMVACPPCEWDDQLQHTLLNPKVVIEVLSPTTEHKDRVAKWFAYQRIESLSAYVMISQNECRVEYYSRDEGGGWLYRVVEEEGDVILASIDCRLSLTDIYERVEL